MELKTYNIWEYARQCPMAKEIENAVNNCNKSSVNLEKIREILGDDEKVYKFFTACLRYWANTQYYDDRNSVAVLISREIIQKFAVLRNMSVADDLQKEAYGFTLCAHRYLQNEVFKIIIAFLQETGHEGVYEWYKACEFVIDKTQDKAIPYQEYKKTHFCHF